MSPYVFIPAHRYKDKCALKHKISYTCWNDHSSLGYFKYKCLTLGIWTLFDFFWFKIYYDGSMWHCQSSALMKKVIFFKEDQSIYNPSFYFLNSSYIDGNMSQDQQDSAKLKPMFTSWTLGVSVGLCLVSVNRLALVSDFVWCWSMFGLYLILVIL